MPSTAAMRPRGPELARNTLPSFGAALAMHALLILGMWFAVQWRTSSEAPAVAELWEPLAPIQPPTPAPEAPPPAPPQPVAAQPDADIVQQQQVKKHAPELESPPPIERQPIEKEPKKIEPKKVEPKKEPTREQVERQERAAEERRQAEIARLTGEVTGSARTPSASSGVMSATYKAMINACIRPHIVFAVPEDTSPQVYAEFEVQLLPTGEQAALPKLVRPSGLPGYDDAAERAIIRCDPFPRQSDGTVPRTFTLKMYPTETR
jgi:colicin import membrane protein